MAACVSRLKADRILGVVVMIVDAVIGASATLAIFDTFIIVASAFGGAGLAMDGVHLVAPPIDMLNRTTIADGALVPLIVWIVIGAISMDWQFINIERWTASGGDR